MKKRKNKVLAVVASIFKKYRNAVVGITAGVLIPAVIWAANTQFSAPSQSAGTVINCMVQGACNIVITTPTADISGMDVLPPTATTEKFGASSGASSTQADEVTRWISGDFDDDLNVDGEFVVTGTTTSFGPVRGLPKVQTRAMANSTTTCAILNNSGADRIMTGMSALFASTTYSASAATAMVAGTSTITYATNTSPILNTSLQYLNGGLALTTTSTFGSLSNITSSTLAYVLWRQGEYLTWKSGTSTNSGTCFVEYYQQ